MRIRYAAHDRKPNDAGRNGATSRRFSHQEPQASREDCWNLLGPAHPEKGAGLWHSGPSLAGGAIGATGSVQSVRTGRADVESRLNSAAKAGCFPCGPYSRDCRDRAPLGQPGTDDRHARPIAGSATAPRSGTSPQTLRKDKIRLNMSAMAKRIVSMGHVMECTWWYFFTSATRSLVSTRGPVVPHRPHRST
jgi:hypothetical protein